MWYSLVGHRVNIKQPTHYFIVSQVVSDDFWNILYRYVAIKDILWFHYYCRTNLAKTMATSKLYFNV